MNPVRVRRVCAMLAPLLSLLPFWAVSVPACSDLLNHVARAHVLAELDQTPRYQAFYQAAWGAYPNLGFDLFAVPLSGLLPPLLVAKLFISLMVLLWALGCQATSISLLGRVSLRASIASFFIVCEPVLLGYVSFGLGSALALLALAPLWRKSAPGPRRIAISAALSLLVAISHAAAIVSLCLAVFALGSLRAVSLLRQAPASGGEPALGRTPQALWCWLTHGLCCAPGALYFFAWLLRDADRSQDRAFSHPLVSLKVLFGSITPSYLASFDAIFLVSLLAATALSVYLLTSRGVRRGPFVVCALLVLAVFVAPADFAGSYEANGRYALLAWALAPFIVVGESRSKLVAACGALVMLLFVTRSIVLTDRFLGFDRVAKEQRALLDQLEPGQSLANVRYLSGSSRAARLSELALLHLPALAVIDRQLNLPTLYAIPGVQPLSHRHPLYDVHRFSLRGPPPNTVRLKAEFDALWLCNAPPELQTELLAGMRSLGRAGGCELAVREQGH